MAAESASVLWLKKYRYGSIVARKDKISGKAKT